MPTRLQSEYLGNSHWDKNERKKKHSDLSRPLREMNLNELTAVGECTGSDAVNGEAAQ